MREWNQKFKVIFVVVIVQSVSKTTAFALNKGKPVASTANVLVAIIRRVMGMREWLKRRSPQLSAIVPNQNAWKNTASVSWGAENVVKIVRVGVVGIDGAK